MVTERHQEKVELVTLVTETSLLIRSSPSQTPIYGIYDFVPLELDYTVKDDESSEGWDGGGPAFRLCVPSLS